MSHTQLYENSTDEFASNKWKDEWGDIGIDDQNYIYNRNYIDWITYDVKKYPEYNGYTFDFKYNNNNVAAISQENLFTNENQNDIDILAASGGFYNENYNDTSFQSTICAENLPKYLSEIDENNNEETPEGSNDIPMDTDMKYEESTIKKNIERQKNLCKGKYYDDDIIYEKYKEEDDDKEEEKDSIGEKEPPDNMRNVKQEKYASEKFSSRNPNYQRYKKYYQTKKCDRKTNWYRTIEIRPNFININNKNEKTNNISSNRYANIDSYNQYS